MRKETKWMGMFKDLVKIRMRISTFTSLPNHTAKMNCHSKDIQIVVMLHDYSHYSMLSTLHMHRSL